MTKNILLIDNYDSFTYNLSHYMQELGASVEVVRNDAVSVQDIADKIAAGTIDGILISPGPATPNESGVCLQMIEALAGKIPMLGVCLGHQAIAQAFGGEVIRAPKPVHGKTAAVKHMGNSVFKDIPSPFEATRYHSLIVNRENLPDCFDITAELECGMIMGIAHKDFALHGVQFHPESIASEHGHDLLKNFLDLL